MVHGWTDGRMLQLFPQPVVSDVSFDMLQYLLVILQVLVAPHCGGWTWGVAFMSREEASFRSPGNVLEIMCFILPIGKSYVLKKTQELFIQAM